MIQFLNFSLDQDPKEKWVGFIRKPTFFFYQKETTAWRIWGKDAWPLPIRQLPTWQGGQSPAIRCLLQCKLSRFSNELSCVGKLAVCDPYQPCEAWVELGIKSTQSNIASSNLNERLRLIWKCWFWPQGHRVLASESVTM